MKDQTGFVLLVVLNVARKNIELKGCHRGCKIKMILSTNIDNIKIRRLKKENDFLEEASAFFAASRLRSAKTKE